MAENAPKKRAAPKGAAPKGKSAAKSATKKAAPAAARKPVKGESAARPRNPLLSNDKSKIQYVGGDNVRVREGSKAADMHALLKKSKTVGAYLDNGGGRATLRKAIAAGIVKVTE